MLVFLLAQRLEQYLTCSQLFRHFLRHVNFSPQVGQVLKGKLGLRCGIYVAIKFRFLVFTALVGVWIGLLVYLCGESFDPMFERLALSKLMRTLPCNIPTDLCTQGTVCMQCLEQLQTLVIWVLRGQSHSHLNEFRTKERLHPIGNLLLHLFLKRHQRKGVS